MFPVWIAITFLAFGLGAIAPGDPAEAIYYHTFGVPPTDQAALDELRDELGLNDPFLVRYGLWTYRALQGDLGISTVPVTRYGANWHPGFGQPSSWRSAV